MLENVKDDDLGLRLYSQSANRWRTNIGVIIVKKKIMVTALMCAILFGGVVTASSINGDYKGNPIVNVVVNGKTVSSDVPAIIYDGSTLIPLRAAVESIGGQVTWDNSTYTANISANASNKPDIIEKMKKDNLNVSKWNGRNVKYVVNELGAYVSVDVLATNNVSTDANNISTVSTYLIGTDADMIFINYYSGNILLGFYTVYKEDVTAMLYSTDSKTLSEYVKSWKWTGSSSSPSSSSASPSNLTSSVIETSIDGTFEGWTGDTIFKLSNGQIWQQSEYAYTYLYAFMPKVLIYKDSYGAYKMKVDGVDRAIGVKRIK